MNNKKEQWNKEEKSNLQKEDQYKEELEFDNFELVETVNFNDN